MRDNKAAETSHLGATVFRAREPVRFWILNGLYFLLSLLLLAGAIFVMGHEEITGFLDQQGNWKPLLIPILIFLASLIFLIFTILALASGEIRMRRSEIDVRVIGRKDEPVYYWLGIGLHVLVVLGLLGLAGVFTYAILKAH